MNTAETMQATTCVPNGNQKAIVKELKMFKGSVRGLVEGANKIFQLMAATRSGICGAGAVSHVVEELRNALVHARNPPLQTVARAAAY